ncbi:MAG: DUF6226 family protein [Actinomycetota bacterium]
MVSEGELLAAVDRRFDPGALGLAGWDDPDPDRNPPDEAYSRLTDPGKWAIVGVRADAWVDALVGSGVAEVEGLDPSWGAGFGPFVTSARRVVPAVARALPLVVARIALWDAGEVVVEDGGILLGVGEPAVPLGPFPDCGCDACDSGSADALEELDTHVLSVVTGVFRHLARPERRRVFPGWRPVAQSITVIERDGWSASNFPGRKGREEAKRILADPVGWDETSGSSWLD